LNDTIRRGVKNIIMICLEHHVPVDCTTRKSDDYKKKKYELFHKALLFG
jgi:hypothetical protein